MYLNKQKLFAGNESAAPETLSLSSTLLRSGDFVIAYVEKNPQQGWKRTFFIEDANGNEIVKKDGGIYKLKSNELLSLLKKHKQLRFSTWSLPTDPQQAALVRVRRISLGTVELK